MEDIKVGEYVRINNDFRPIALGIGKVLKINKDSIYVKTNFELPFSFKKENIAKHSKQLIDLIEVGDYVNGYLVVNVINGEYAPSGKCVDIDSSKQSEECTIWEDDIKSIVTKEQFENIEYEV